MARLLRHQRYHSPEPRGATVTAPRPGHRDRLRDALSASANADRYPRLAPAVCRATSGTRGCRPPLRCNCFKVLGSPSPLRLATGDWRRGDALKSRRRCNTPCKRCEAEVRVPQRFAGAMNWFTRPEASLRQAGDGTASWRGRHQWLYFRGACRAASMRQSTMREEADACWAAAAASRTSTRRRPLAGEQVLQTSRYEQ